MKLGQRLLWLWLFVPLLVSAQIDPARRDLVQFGYNQAFQGHVPVAGYAFYYHNQPDFLRTNLTLRLAVAPVYLDSELGFVNGLGPNTDFGIGVAGGGFADSYNEIHNGTYFPSESFEGNGAEMSASLYHLFNPADQIPLNYVLRGSAHYSFYKRNNDTAPDFELPNDHASFDVRTGLRWGGVEPTLFPPLAMELSAWYEGSFRTDPGTYGINHAYDLRPQSQLFWSEAARVLNSPAFTFKLLMILLGGLNAAYFEFVLAKRHEHAADPTASPRSFRIAGAASIVLWSLVIIGGRLIPYLPSWSGAPDAIH